MTVLAAAQTDIGCVRRNNEDSFGGDAEQQIYVVCDGMGGVAGGEVASAIAVEEFLKAFDAAIASGDADAETARSALFHAAVAANKAVYDRALLEPHHRGMGATLVAAHVTGERLLVINVGDSRAYLFRDGEPTQLTLDHTFLSEQVRRGLMTQAMADESPMQSVITRAIGIEESVEPDLFGVDLEQGDLVLLASDGLTRYVTDEEITQMVSGPELAGPQELAERCEKLIEMAKARGGADNITCILMQASAT
ncbi:MAG TPA: Stp1/IreP family PP2C-type Ser/Thr phosphatase [Granulicella sp.]